MTDRKLLMIPGPIEFEPAVLEAMARPTLSHVDPAFIASFGNALRMMREVWMCASGQPFVVAGSGTLAMDMAGANLIEPGDKVLVLVTGYFGHRYAELLKRYGAEVTVLEAPLGDTVPLDEVERELAYGNFKLMTFTHVDTSTGVLVDPRPLAELAQQQGVLTILDGVCSIAGEEMRQEEWQIDVAVTASQKAIGVPPGLALMMVSPMGDTIMRASPGGTPMAFCDAVTATSICHSSCRISSPAIEHTPSRMVSTPCCWASSANGRGSTSTPVDVSTCVKVISLKLP